jgi:hypothetical protein
MVDTGARGHTPTRRLEASTVRREATYHGGEYRHNHTMLPHRGRSRRQHQNQSFILRGHLKPTKASQTRTQTVSAVRVILYSADSKSGTFRRLTMSLMNFLPFRYPFRAHGRHLQRKRYPDAALFGPQDAVLSYTRMGRLGRATGRGTPKGKRRSASSSSIRCTSSTGGCRSSSLADADGTVWAARSGELSLPIHLGTVLLTIARF